MRKTVIEGRRQVSPIKVFSPVALLALLVLAFAGTSTALAEGTILCSNDSETECEEVTHIHEMTLASAKAKLLTSVFNVECDVLFLGEIEAGAPATVEGNFTYTNCGSCTVEELNGPSVIEALWVGHETTSLAYESEIHVSCSGLNCYYNGEGLEGTGKGPLLSSETNGSNSISEKTLNKVKGLFCPAISKLDIKLTPLAAVFIQPMKMVCIRVEPEEGYFLSLGNTTTCAEEDEQAEGEYELGWVKLGTPHNVHVCAYVGPERGFFLLRNGPAECTMEHEFGIGKFELGETT